MPRQECIENGISLELQRFFGLEDAHLHHTYTTGSLSLDLTQKRPNDTSV